MSGKPLLTIFALSLAVVVSSCNAPKTNKVQAKDANANIELKIPLITDIVAVDQKIKLLIDEMNFLEGPIWDSRNSQLIFSEVMANKLHCWSAKNGLTTYLEPSW